MGGDLILDEEARVQPKHEKVQREVREHQQREEQGRGRGDNGEAGKHGGAADRAAGKHEEDDEGGGKYEIVANKTSGGGRIRKAGPHSSPSWPPSTALNEPGCRVSGEQTKGSSMGGDLILDEEARVQPKHEKVQREVREHQQREEQGRGRGDNGEAGKHGGAADRAAGKHEEDDEGGGKYEIVANKTSGGGRS
ncbi:hypothetical protein LR48_Vigan01g109300 [Vigna angularis]|uniref:Uncharacterized protein n=1 Tax=Phaseolus angularis TaxID=3914 RepID=A0A0L9TLT3_PHAAN|nr:hypothetical protein LR48_Vigan01g109300 [Vigna angularis]